VRWEVEFVNQLPTFQLILAAEGVGVGALLDFVAVEAVGGDARAGDGFDPFAEVQIT